MEKVREIEEGQIRSEYHSQEIDNETELHAEEYEGGRLAVELTDLLGNFSEQTGALFG